MPAAPFDDPSIPVLTERLVLPALDLDVTLPTESDEVSAAAPEATPAPPPPPAREEPAAPTLLGSEFETDDWLVETIPLAPAPIDLSSFDLPPLDLPQTELMRADPPLPVPMAAPVPRPTIGQRDPVPARPTLSPPPAATVTWAQAEPVRPAPPAAEGFVTTDLLIPASLIRVPAVASATLPSVTPTDSAPTFDRLPPTVTGDALPPLDTPGGATTAFAAGQAQPNSAGTAAHWTQLEVELRESILRNLLTRLPQDLLDHGPIAAAVDAAVKSATEQFSAQLRRALTDSLHAIAEQAVKDELARLRELKH